MGVLKYSGLALVLTAGLVVGDTHSQGGVRYLYTPASCQDGQQEGKYLAAVPTSCSQFYSCAPGHVAALMNCSAGTLFDLDLRTCLGERSVDCGDRPRPPGAAPPLGVRASTTPDSPAGEPEPPVAETYVDSSIREVVDVRPSLRQGAVAVQGFQYRLAMSEPFTATNFDFIACQRLQRSLEDVFLNDPFVAGCLNDDRGCSIPQFRCQRSDVLLSAVTSSLSASSSTPLSSIPSSSTGRSPLFNFINFMRNR
ncbi:hypothetical protein V1264_007817 [Littorina saxatilis]